MSLSVSQLLSTSVSALATLKPVGMRRLVRLEETYSVEVALETLQSNSVLSAPVWSKSSGRYLGFVDVLDLVTFLVAAVKRTLGDQTVTAALLVETVRACAARVLSTCVVECIDASHSDPFEHVSPSATVADVLALLSRDVYRVAVMDSDGKITDVVTQRDLVEWFAANGAVLALPMLAEPVSRFASPDVVTIDEDAVTMFAFAAVSRATGAAAAVVDARRRLVETLSATDLFGVEIEEFDALARPLKEFLRPLRGELAELKERVRARPSPALDLCHMGRDATLGQALTNLASTGVHRVWVVDNEHRPVGVITLTIMLAALAKAFAAS